MLDSEIGDPCMKEEDIQGLDRGTKTIQTTEGDEADLEVMIEIVLILEDIQGLEVLHEVEVGSLKATFILEGPEQPLIRLNYWLLLEKML